MKHDKGALMSKIDIKRAYRNIPICEQDRHLLCMNWRDQFYVDLALSFRGASGSHIFNRSADLLCWIFCDNSIHIKEDDIDRYYDDFFSCAPPNSDQCLNGLNDCLKLARS